MTIDLKRRNKNPNEANLPNPASTN